MKQVDRYTELQRHMKDVSPRVGQAFSAAIAERLLPSTENSMSKWRHGSWRIFRNALDNAWNYLEKGSVDKRHLEEIIGLARKKVPGAEDKSWDGAHGVFAACVTTILTLDAIISENTSNVADASNEAIEELRQFIVTTRYGHLEVEPYFDEDEIFETELIRNEVRSQDSQLEMLELADQSDAKFSEGVLHVKKFSEDNPIIFELR